VCGRLLCCLSYEHEQYLQIKGELPRKGAWVQTPDGPGEVVSVNVVRETVIVELAGSMAHEEFSPSQISEAGERVAALARSRAEEGVAPAPPTTDTNRESAAQQQQKRERRQPEPRRDRGERRLLRDEIDNPEVLDALAMLEEGHDDDEPRAADAGQPQQPGPPRRPFPTQRRSQPQQPAPHPQQQPAPQERPAQDPEPQGGHGGPGQALRRRRRKG
jgi:hypothetical protein